MTNKTPWSRGLSDEALESIELTAYRLLAEVGIVLDHTEAQEMLHGLGCRIADGRTTIPRHVVDWALDNVTPHLEVIDLEGSLAFTFGDEEIRFHNGGGPPFIYDLNTGGRRASTMQDVADMTRLLDALPNVDVVIPLFGPQDVPPQLLTVASTAETLRNTRKPVGAAAVEKAHEVGFMVEMAAACCGGFDAYWERPNLMISVSPVSPLTFTEDVTAAIIAVVASGTPFHTLPAPCLGATGPITLAGALAQQHAEVLASLVIAAATRPGAPVAYCSRISPIDLRTAVSSWGGPEVGMTGAFAGQLAHRLGLPCDAYGLSTSSSHLDARFAYERLTNAFVPAMAGVDILSGVGTTDSGLAGGFEIAVIDNEIISLIKHVAAGCVVNDDTLAFDVIKDVVLGDGVFLAEGHTVKHMREGELWISDIGAQPAAAERAGDTVVARARARASHILQTHQVSPLPDDVSMHLDGIMDRARRELAKD
ncbi:MAG: trimethylamine methyltransferase family protein [Anaerolineae bacterium]